MITFVHPGGDSAPANNLMSEPHEITELLHAWSRGEPGALEKLTPLVYKELHGLARRYMAQERSGHTLQTTALVNEAYLRLASAGDAGWESRAHFFAASARAMRRILVDWARSRQATKRGGEVKPLQLEEALALTDEHDPDLVALDDALNALAALDLRKSRVVELRFFGGLSIEETAHVLKVSPHTVTRDWRFAKVWLRREITQGEPSEP
ncbi:MAG TPA: sigma-70 family RNA polymerase sigma factor [Terriglobia bacterium]|nr:sigma-70 family RNA polymerase sigma factor [Terriglobia bacterium]